MDQSCDAVTLKHWKHCREKMTLGVERAARFKSPHTIGRPPLISSLPLLPFALASIKLQVWMLRWWIVDLNFLLKAEALTVIFDIERFPFLSLPMSTASSANARLVIHFVSHFHPHRTAIIIATVTAVVTYTVSQFPRLVALPLATDSAALGRCQPANLPISCNAM